MRTVQVFCNRCKQQIPVGVTVMTISVPAGRLAARLSEPIDTCIACSDSFLEWLNATPNPPKEATYV
jgi:hypothetical protein